MRIHSLWAHHTHTHKNTNSDPHLKQIENFCAPDLDAVLCTLTRIHSFHFRLFGLFLGRITSVYILNITVKMATNDLQLIRKVFKRAIPILPLLHAPIFRHDCIYSCFFLIVWLQCICNVPLIFSKLFSAKEPDQQKKTLPYKERKGKKHTATNNNNKIASLLNLNGYLPISLLSLFPFSVWSHGIRNMDASQAKTRFSSVFFIFMKERERKKKTIMQT